jgi:hypothetical protein
MKVIEELQVLPLGDPGDPIAAIEGEPFIDALVALGGIARLAGHDGVVADLWAAPAPGDEMVRCEIFLGTAIDAFAGLFPFLDPFPDGAGPLDLAGGQTFKAAHYEAVIVLPETGGVGDDLGVLPEDEVFDCSYCTRWHVGSLSDIDWTD